MSAPASAGGSSAATSSGSKRSLPAAAAERRVQPRRSPAGSTSVGAAASSSADGAAAANGAHPHPAATVRLHRHALESIFAFLNLCELATALQASRGWLAAVKSMASLRLAVTPLQSVSLRVVAESTMGRHVARLGTDNRFVSIAADSLPAMARLMPQLHYLDCKVELPVAPGPLAFPSGLQTLALRFFRDPPTTVGDVNAALLAVSRLPLLESFTVVLAPIDSQLSFAPLASMAHLRELRITDDCCGWGTRAVLSDAQVAQLRALPQLRRLGVYPMSTLLLRRLLAQPHNLQWQEIGLPDPLEDADAALLPQLPSLTTIDAQCLVSQFEWLPRLPNLTRISLLFQLYEVEVDVESLVAELQRCTQIESLSLAHCPGLLTAHLAALLPHLPRLRALELAHLRIQSLSFLAQEPMVRQLTDLAVTWCTKLRGTAAQLRHVHALKGLQTLDMCRSFSASLSPASLRLLTPPSAALPQLHKFEYYSTEWP